MRINCVDMKIMLTRAPDAFYLLEPRNDNKVRITILTLLFLSPTLNWSTFFFLLTLMFWEWNAKFIILLNTFKLNLYCEVWGPALLHS